jgi:hypothetical protein
MPKDSQELKEKLMQIVNEAVSVDAKLRADLNIGDKFRFIRDRLQALKQQVEETLQTIKVEETGTKQVIADDEQLVYVYLFNAHGIDTQSWMKMLHPSVYYEHSVNRPIYGAKEHVEMVIRNKSNRVQHGYLEVAVKKTAILNKDDESLKDSLGNPLLKIKEGSLLPERLICLTHNGNLYCVDENGRLAKIN